MSGCSYMNTCPICDNEMSCCSDTKPFDYIGGQCSHCGFSYYTKVEQLDIDEVNALRKDDDLEPITKKEYKKWSKEIKEIY